MFFKQYLQPVATRFSALITLQTHAADLPPPQQQILMDARSSSRASSFWSASWISLYVCTLLAMWKRISSTRGTESVASRPSTESASSLMASASSGCSTIWGRQERRAWMRHHCSWEGVRLFCLLDSPPAQIVTGTYLINNLSHVLHTLILQPGELEKLCRLPHVHHVVLAQSLRQGFPTEALQSRQQIHVGHAQHVEHALYHQLRGKTSRSPNQSLTFPGVKCRKSSRQSFLTWFWI